MRALFWLWVMFIVVCLVTDTATYWVVRNRLGQGLELALDAALVGGVVEEDLIRGRHLSRKEKAGEWAWEILKKNMSGPLAGSLTFRFDLAQSGDQVWVEGQAKVEAPFLLGAIAGSGRREIVVNRKMTYQGHYK